MNAKNMLSGAAIAGMLAVVFGAFGAHALKKILEPEQLSAFETAVRYQFYHALLLALISLLGKNKPHLFLTYAAYAAVSGMLLFCGSIYLLSIQHVLNMNLSFLGPVTPLGGLCFIASWILVFLYATKASKGE